MTRQALPERQQIESALEQVRCGELSLAEATQMLLASESLIPNQSFNSGGLAADCDVAKAADPESLASLIDRLGKPPADIVRSWCQQITQVAVIHERETGEPLPSIQLAHWTIDSSGQLSWMRRQFAIEEDSVATPQMQVSLDHLNQFRQALLSGHAGAGDTAALSHPHAPALTTFPGRTSENDRGKSDSNRQDRQPAKLKKHSRRLAIVGVLLGSGAAIIATLSLAWQPESVSTASSDTSPADKLDSPDDREPNRSGLANVDPIATSETESGLLETFDSIAASTAEDVAGASFGAQSLSLGARMPNAADFLPLNDDLTATQREPPNHSELTVQGGDEVENEKSQNDNGGATGADTMDDGSAMQEEDAPDELPQETRASAVTAIDLPPVNDSTALMKLWEEPTAEFKLEFPFDVPLVTTSSETGWTIKDARKDLPVATIDRVAQLTQLSWHEQATESSSASALLHGRLTNDTGSMIYLRPLLQADPWPIRLDQFDVRPTWDLRQPIPPRVARLSAEFELPEGIDLAWIEAIDPTTIRRARGLAVLTHEDGETVALGMRLDVRCGRKLSCRVRFAARLDPMMPWQTVSTSSLDQFAEQLTQRAAVLSRETASLAARYERVDSQNRRTLRINQEQVKSAADTIRVASERVAQLQSLITLLESEALMKLRVWVEWPEQQQTILEMKSDSD